ncbi:MAG: tail fiber protein, partial [Muribaculaceae bacterium]
MKTIGNYVNQQYRNFPLDAEGLLAIQDNIATCEMLGMLAGDKAIIQGCALNDAGTHRGAGWVWLRTQAAPCGELLYFTGGAISSNMYVKTVAVSVDAEGYKYPQAYTERSLAPGEGAEKYMWSDFHVAKATEELRKVIEEQAGVIASIKPVPVGVIEMWAGHDAPMGYMMCEGQSVAIADYSELYVAIGTSYNMAPSWNGVVSAPVAGCFRLPDLRGRFIVGGNTQDNDYKVLGTAGGEKMVSLCVDNMPTHKHSINDYGVPFVGGGQSEHDHVIDGEKVHAGQVSSTTDTLQGATASGTTRSITVYKHETKAAGG